MKKYDYNEKLKKLKFFALHFVIFFYSVKRENCK